MIVGIAGAIQAGKDTIAAYLVRQHGFVRVGWADALKHEVLHRLRRTIQAHYREWLRDSELPMTEDAWTVFLLDRLWRHRDPFTRALLQEYGTELRRADDPDYWVNEWGKRVANIKHHIVVPDTRFQNEAQQILRSGGYLWKVTRPGYGGDAHQSEQDLATWPTWHTILINDGTITDLECRAEAAFVQMKRLDKRNE